LYAVHAVAAVLQKSGESCGTREKGEAMIWYLTGKTLRLLLASDEFADDELYEVTDAGIRKVE
jgi:hypothetical protein